MQKALDSFSSRIAFILVTAGAAVGLGNIWYFPFVVGKSGGGTFLILYVVMLLLIATPVFVAELLLGRMGAASPPTALKNLAKREGAKLPWHWIGWMGVVGTVFILSFYSVISGQALAYAGIAVTGDFTGLSAAEIVTLDAAFKANFLTPAIWHTAFMMLTTWVVAQDIRSGIERAGKYLMPLLFIILFLMVVYAVTTAGFGAAVDYMFTFSVIDITPSLLIKSFGLAFFTLSVGVGGIMMYGAYMGKDIKLGNTVGWIVGMDLMVAILAGLAIFSLVFAHGLDAGAGPGLVFQTLPIIFASVAGGSVLGTAFFLLLTVAALTSAISLMSPSVQWFVEKGWSRRKASVLMGFIIYILGYATVFSFNIWGDWAPLGFIESLSHATIFDLISETINVIVLPIGGLAFALMIGWGMSRTSVMKALPAEGGMVFTIWYWSLRVLVPLAVLALFVSAFL